MKLLVLGYARHGKDTFAEILAECLGLTFRSSSLFAAEKVVFPAMKELLGYRSPTECFEDRASHRGTWFRLIQEFNAQDPSRLARELISTYDIYVGMRCRRELKACAKLFDLIVWVDAAERHPPEPPESCTVTRADADIVVDNNGGVEDLVNRTVRLGLFLKKMQAEYGQMRGFVEGSAKDPEKQKVEDCGR